MKLTAPGLAAIPVIGVFLDVATALTRRFVTSGRYPLKFRAASVGSSGTDLALLVIAFALIALSRANRAGDGSTRRDGVLTALAIAAGLVALTSAVATAATLSLAWPNTITAATSVGRLATVALVAIVIAWQVTLLWRSAAPPTKSSAEV